MLFWKVIIRGTGQDERVIAWVVPNTQEATRKRLDHYLVSVDELEHMKAKRYLLLIMQNMTNLINLG